MVIRIVIHNLLGDDNKLQIGGVQSYISALANEFVNDGKRVLIYQYSDHIEELQYSGYNIKKVKANTSRKIIKYIERDEHDYDSDILIFATDYLICKHKFKHSIAIQHGVAWDITKPEPASDFQNYISIAKNAFRSIKKYNRYKHCSNLVCVDYNFINWYRTQVAHINEKINIIPNFTVIPTSFAPRENENVSVVFARRFFSYRGTRLFTETVMELLDEIPNFNVTIAGSGPDEKWMKSRFKDNERVTFTSFSSVNSIAFHSNFDIAIVPTTGSEGTSLSLLEAMAAGCAVICSNVGGMTNIVIDGYNGLMVNPQKEDLKRALSSLIRDGKLRHRLAQKGYETVESSFSLSKWSKAWIGIIEEVSES